MEFVLQSYYWLIKNILNIEQMYFFISMHVPEEIVLSLKELLHVQLQDWTLPKIFKYFILYVFYF